MANDNLIVLPGGAQPSDDPPSAFLRDILRTHDGKIKGFVIYLSITDAPPDNDVLIYRSHSMTPPGLIHAGSMIEYIGQRLALPNL